MEIAGLQGLDSLWRTGGAEMQRNLLNPAAETADQPARTFDSFLRAMMDNISETNQAIVASQEFQLNVAQGYSDDLIGLTLAIDRANSSLNFTVQVVNRMLEAYREIMRMQV